MTRDSSEFSLFLVRMLLCLLLGLWVAVSGVVGQQVAQPGGAGYAVVLNNHALLKDDFNNFPTVEFTFEAWMSTYYTCHPGALMSYALDPKNDDDARSQLRDLNHFVIHHVPRVIGCHDYETGFLSGVTGLVFAQLGIESCLSDYVDRNQDLINPEFERNGTWHHVAVTWTAANDGEMNVYKNGILVGSAVTGKTRPLQSDGIFMLGGKQDCFGGCSDSLDAYFGLMDEVRIWNVSRTPEQVSAFMSLTGSVFDDEEGLVAYWKFDDPSLESFDEDRLAIDSSGNENHIQLFRPPVLRDVTLPTTEENISASALVFENSYALNSEVREMPVADVTVEFWGRLLVRPFDPTHPQDVDDAFRAINLMSYVTKETNPFDEDDVGFTANVLSIYVDLTEWNNTSILGLNNFSTRGSIWVGFSGSQTLWIEFDTQWLDNAWHHIAMTYNREESLVRLFFDGEESIPFWKLTTGGRFSAHPDSGGVGGELPVEPRSSAGSLAIGKFQACFAGCFSTASTFYGMMANYRIWKRTLSRRQILNSMINTLNSVNSRQIALAYDFTEDSIVDGGRTGRYVRDQRGNATLFLGSVLPHYDFSNAPLTDSDGAPLDPPSPGVTGYAYQLTDQHVVSLSNFTDFPTDTITIEFWMWSIDRCNPGVPFSYSVDQDGEHVDVFTVANYNNWIVVVDDRSGVVFDQGAGFGSTDGTWHHIAVTWERETGNTLMYDNGRLHWSGTRASEGLLPGGTLVLGREQDCLGGCFDSADTAFEAQRSSGFTVIQDFFGLIDNVRIWNSVRTADEIFQSMRFDLDIEDGEPNAFIEGTEEDLVAWWKFDEGRGRRVEDATGKGHTLRIRGTPSWIVSSRLGECGDGLLSQMEQCDDGNRRDEDGCSFDCRLEIPLDELTEDLEPGAEVDISQFEVPIELSTEPASAEMSFVDPTFDRSGPLLDDDIL